MLHLVYTSKQLPPASTPANSNTCWQYSKSHQKRNTQEFTNNIRYSFLIWDNKGRNKLTRSLDMSLIQENCHSEGLLLLFLGSAWIVFFSSACDSLLETDIQNSLPLRKVIMFFFQPTLNSLCVWTAVSLWVTRFLKWSTIDFSSHLDQNSTLKRL